MNRQWLVLLLFVVLLLLTHNQARAEEVEITAEPSHHLVLENDQVRVFSVTVAPGKATLMHRHRHDYVYVAIGDARISNEIEGREPVEAMLSDGEVRFTKGNFAHIVRDLSATPFRNVTIELLQDEKRRAEKSTWDKDSGEDSYPGADRKIVSVKDGVRISQIEIDPKAFLPKGRHNGPILLIAVSAIELSARSDGKEPVGKLLKPGDVWWLDATPSLNNAGTGPAELVMLEF